MGIRGLTTYINNRSDRFLEYFELYDTYVVVDGNSVCCQLYCWHAKCNCAFGGDYDKYAQCVSDFFDDLLKCNVTPLVLIDGGCEDKKLKTVINRTKDKIQTASSFCPLSQQRSSFLPLLLKEVFKDVVQEKNIRVVQCLFEADNAIAAVARILDCPVLSYDSDFYIYGSSYIPFNTVDNYVVKRSNGIGYMKRCKIYKVKYLFNHFKGLNHSVLPLAAILLGNDYVKRGTFKNFFRHIKVRGASRKKHNYRQCCIEATFVWLSNYTLEKAVIAILSRLCKSLRQTILDIIETNINSYTNVSADILVPLGFSEDYVTRVNTHSINRTFKFNGDINTLTYIEEVCEDDDSETSEDEEEDDTGIVNTLKESEFVPTNVLVNKLPVWFVNEFLMARYPSYFMDLIVRRLYICPMQVEDYYSPSSTVISLKIIRVLFGLLISGVDNQIGSMAYMTRSGTKTIARFELEGAESIFSCKLPSLFSLREIPIIIRREIISNTLEIVDKQCINEFPSEWMLYIACIKYWMGQQELYRSQKCYLYSLLTCMLFNVIDSKIGRHRNMYNFRNKYSVTLQAIQHKRKENGYKPHYSMNVTIADACNEIDYDDCLLAAPFFVSHFEMDRKLYSNPKKFNKSIVHAFAEFQSCLRHTMNLNALLGYPYSQTRVADLFNGTFLYNLSSNLRTRNHMEGYINAVLHNSPSVLRLYNVLLLKVKPLLKTLESDDVSFCKKQKTKSKRTKSESVAESDAEYFSADESLNEPEFYDANNPYSILNSA